MQNIGLIFLILICTVQHGFGQSLHFTDSAGSPIPWVQVTLQNKDQKHLLLADVNGKIESTELKNGVFLRLSVMGYQSDTVQYSTETKTIILKTVNYGLDEFVVTAQYQPVSVENSVNRIRVITADDIEKRGAVSLEDVLKNELNFQINRDNILGTSTSMQGMSGNSVKIMVDGVPIIGRLDGNIDLTQINLNQIERIEIVEGPLSVNYGSNALAGTINLITKRGITNQTSTSTTGYTQSSGHFNLNADASIGWSKQSLLISAGRNYFDGWNPGDDSFYYNRSNVADDSRVQSWNPREQYFGDAKYRSTFNRGYAEIGAGIFDEEIINRGAPRGAYKETALDDIYRTLRYNFTGKLQYKMSKEWSTHLVLAYNAYRRTKSTYVTDLTGVRSEMSSDASLSDTTGYGTYLARGSFIGALSPGFELQLGYELEYELAEGKRIQDQTGEIGNYAVFATAKWLPLDKLTIKPGVRFAYNSRFDAPIVPSLHMLYDLPAKWQARVSYAHGFRAPGLKELSYYFVDVNHNIQGNSDLQAETSQNFSFSLKKNSDAKHKLSLEFSGYYNDIQNLITLALKEGTEYTYVNIGERQTLGIRGEVGYNFGALSLKTGIAYLGVSNNLDNPGADKFTFTPEANASAAYFWESPKINFNLYYKYNGKQTLVREDENEELYETFTEAYSNLDLSLTRNFFSESLTIGIGAQNILGVEDIQQTTSAGAHSGGGSYSIATGRTYFFQLKYQFNKRHD